MGFTSVGFVLDTELRAGVLFLHSGSASIMSILVTFVAFLGFLVLGIFFRGHEGL